MPNRSFILRHAERGHDLIKSTGVDASYVAGHPDGYITRESSFNFHQYQSGRPGFGPMRVFGDETFHGTGCGYNMHPHHNFVICAFVFAGELTHVNTAGEGVVDRLRPGDYYVFSAGAGGKHCELSVSREDMQALYIWLLPRQLHLPASYHRGHFDFRKRRHQLVQLVGDADDALPLPQDMRISRLLTDAGGSHSYRLRSPSHGVYLFVREGAARCNGIELGRRDSAGMWEMEDAMLHIEVLEDDSDIIVVETIMVDDERFRDWERTHVNAEEAKPAKER